MADHRTVPAWPTPYWESVGILDLGLHRQGVDCGHIYCGWNRWGTGGVSVEGDGGRNCRVKPSHDRSRVCTPTMQLADSWKPRHSCGLGKYRIP
ncbi:hypothetical protein L208DRAFT_1403346 [Tricholoma matsutake]|nr:hypothetical protein L208DRAFT_1403346 [Tricholoma matsutake 945]